MNNIIILVDSTSSFTKEKASILGVTIVPTTFILNGTEYNPLEADFSLDEFYQKLYSEKVGTACINEYTFEEIFRKYLNKGKKVLYISLSSGLSSSYNNALSAANKLNEEYKDSVAVIDTLTGGMGMSYAVTEALKLIEKDISLVEIKKLLDKNALGVKSYFTIGSLDHLYKGGRLNKFGVVIGNTLKAKPIVKANHEGKLKIRAIHLGKRKTIKEMGDLVLKNVNEDYPVQISYTNNLEEAEFLKSKIFEGNNKLNIILSKIDYTLACHCGPETIAVFYIKRKYFF